MQSPPRPLRPRGARFARLVAIALLLAPACQSNAPAAGDATGSITAPATARRGAGENDAAGISGPTHAGDGATATTYPRPTNVLLIVIDTLRADHVGVYGARRDTTPSLDRLAREGIRFDRAYATAPWTVPSIASILTGLYPSSHGAQGPRHSLAHEIDTVAEILRDRGFATTAIISHLIMAGTRHFDQGFETFDSEEARLGDEYVSTAGVTARAIAAIEGFAAADRPFFLFVHYFDPHYRYMSHPEVPFAAESEGRVRGGQAIWELRRMDPPLTAAEVDFLRDLYDEEIYHTDAGIGRLLSAMDDLGLTDDTIVIVTADHGEEFLERGWLGHTRTLYEELIRVPLIMRFPGHPPSVVDQPVSLVSIVPTTLDLLGLDLALFRFDGRSLLPQLGGNAGPGELVRAEVDYKEKVNAAKVAFKKAILDGRWKLIRDDTSGDIELYDLEADPGETNNIATSRADIVRQLMVRLDQESGSARAGDGAVMRTLSPGEIEQLRILGYLSPEEAR